MPDVIPIPPKMRTLPLDPRGYPIPVTVFRDDNGKPHFTINDTRMVGRLTRAAGCHICGQALGAHKWFVGGPGAALHEAGVYIDGPRHRECGVYALQRCPYLSRAEGWNKRIDDKTLRPGDIKRTLILKDSTMSWTQPAVFAFADATDYRVTADRGYFKPVRPWRWDQR